MRNLLRKLTAVIVLIILMPVLNSCVSRQKAEKNEIPVIVNPALDTVYFPSFPYPKSGTLMPVDKDGKAVYEVQNDDEIEISAVVVPYWYWLLVIDYVTKTESAVTALQEYKNEYE